MRWMLFLLAGAAAAEPVPWTVENGVSIPAPLVEGGDPARGAALMRDAGCAECHQKDLNGVGARLAPGEIRLMIVAPETRAPGTEMPAYYTVGVYGEVEDDLVGRTRLSAEEIEALVAYLSDL